MGRGSSTYAAYPRPSAALHGKRAVPVLLAVSGVLAALPGWAGTGWPLGLELVPCFAIAYLYLRHTGLAALTAMAPLPATLGQFAVSSTPDVAALFATSYSLAFCVALFIADGISLRIAEGTALEAAAAWALRGMALRIFFSILAGVAILACLSSMSGTSVLGAAAFAEFVGCVSAALGVALGAPALSFDEDFVARTNRLRERRARWSFHLVPIAQPGFCWSVVGIAALCFVLGVVGVASIPNVAAVWSAAWEPLTVSFLLGFTACFAALRDWRRALATIASLLPAIVPGIWALERVATQPAFPVLGAAAQILIIGMTLVLLSANDAELSITNLVLTLESEIERTAVLAAYACAAAILTLLPLWVLSGSLVLPLVVAILSAGIGAILFQPVFATALKTMVPRRNIADSGRPAF